MGTLQKTCLFKFSQVNVEKKELLINLVCAKESLGDLKVVARQAC